MGRGDIRPGGDLRLIIVQGLDRGWDHIAVIERTVGDKPCQKRQHFPGHIQLADNLFPLGIQDGLGRLDGENFRDPGPSNRHSFLQFLDDLLVLGQFAVQDLKVFLNRQLRVKSLRHILIKLHPRPLPGQLLLGDVSSSGMNGREIPEPSK